MKHIVHTAFALILSLSIIACDSDDSSDDTNTGGASSNSKIIRLEADLGGATEMQISYEVRNTAVVVTEDEGIKTGTKWTKTINIDEDFNFITLGVANISFEGKVTAKVYVGDKLVGSDTSSTAALVAVPF